MLLAVLTEGGKAKVNDLDHVRLVLDEHVVELEVAVRNTTRMKILERLGHLLEEASAHALLDDTVRALRLHVLVQRDAGNVVHHDADLLLRLYQVVHPDDVRVVDLLQRHDLPLHRLALHTVVEFRLLIDLDSVLLHAAFIVARIHHGVRALADGLAYLIRV